LKVEFKMTILSAPPPFVRPRLSVPRYASWQEALRDAVRDPAELCHMLGLSWEAISGARQAARQFPLIVPRGYIARMRPGDLDDPLLRQVLPMGEELAAVSGFVADPVGDGAAIRQPGLLQKYAGRALLLTTSRCAVHCRYCFRRLFAYRELPRSLDEWEPAFDQLAADTSLREIILSGGDPLMLADATLGRLVNRLVSIPQLRRLRIHTRLPIVVPERVTQPLVDLLRGARLQPIVVLHANHVNELDEAVASSIGRLADAGVMLLNQAVLLAGVNDTVEAQAALCERLVDLRVLPYYLHQLDRVAGAAHFEVPVEVGRRIVEQLRERLPGYAMPRYVQEIAGAPSKISLI